MPAKGKKVDFSVVPANVEHSKLDTFERTLFLNVALFWFVTVRVDCFEGLL